MKLQLERKTVETLAGQFPRLATLKDQLRFGNKAEDEVEALQNDMPKSLFTASPPAMPSQSG